jgi:hypothetical protein
MVMTKTVRESVRGIGTRSTETAIKSGMRTGTLTMIVNCTVPDVITRMTITTKRRGVLRGTTRETVLIPKTVDTTRRRNANGIGTGTITASPQGITVSTRGMTGGVAVRGRTMMAILETGTNLTLKSRSLTTNGSGVRLSTRKIGIRERSESDLHTTIDCMRSVLRRYVHAYKPDQTLSLMTFTAPTLRCDRSCSFGARAPPGAVCEGRDSRGRGNITLFFCLAILYDPLCILIRASQEYAWSNVHAYTTKGRAYGYGFGCTSMAGYAASSATDVVTGSTTSIGPIRRRV